MGIPSPRNKGRNGMLVLFNYLLESQALAKVLQASMQGQLPPTKQLPYKGASMSEELKIIPQSELDKGVKHLVHVKDWLKGQCFHYVKTVNGIHHLITPKNRKHYTTTSDLTYTKRYNP